MNILRKVISYTITSVVAVILIGLALSLLPIQGNVKLLVVLSGSMEPAVKTGSLIVIKPFDSYQIGDVITFKGEGEIPTTHRIVEMRVETGKPIYRVKGDANEEADRAEVLQRNVLGKKILHVPYMGYLVETAKKPYGFAALIIIPGVYIIWGEVQKIRKELGHKRKKEE